MPEPEDTRSPDHRPDLSAIEVLPFTLQAQVHIPAAEFVHVHDLLDDTGDDVVELRLGDNTADVAVLGSLQALLDAVADAASRLAAIRAKRGQGGRT